VIIRESAILGILGITTLGFYIDSAFEDIRFDRALFLIVISALLNILVDSFSRKIRSSNEEKY
jgi:phosphonate transport system permease protein